MVSILFLRKTLVVKRLIIETVFFFQKGCINDVNNIKQFIIENYGFKESDTKLLTDDPDQKDIEPTAQNIKEAIKWLVSDQQANDS